MAWGWLRIYEITVGWTPGHELGGESRECVVLLDAPVARYELLREQVLRRRLSRALSTSG